MANYSMVQECTDSYEVVARSEEKGVVITISVPERFEELWLVKLSELQATDEEIAYYSHIEKE